MDAVNSGYIVTFSNIGEFAAHRTDFVLDKRITMFAPVVIPYCPVHYTSLQSYKTFLSDHNAIPFQIYKSPYDHSFTFQETIFIPIDRIEAYLHRMHIPTDTFDYTDINKVYPIIYRLYSQWARDFFSAMANIFTKSYRRSQQAKHEFFSSRYYSMEFIPEMEAIYSNSMLIELS